jgi:hypothetical protein
LAAIVHTHDPEVFTMPMAGALVAVAITFVAVAVGIAARRMAEAWFGFRGQRIVVCPADQSPAGVRVDAGHAALTAWSGDPELRLAGCSHWPDRAACGQVCIRQIEAAPEDCLLRNILAKWFEGKYCARCGSPVSEAYWTGSRPVLLVSGNGLKECEQIPVDQLPGALETALPVCFHCYIQEKAFQRPLGVAAS